MLPYLNLSTFCCGKISLQIDEGFQSHLENYETFSTVNYFIQGLSLFCLAVSTLNT